MQFLGNSCSLKIYNITGQGKGRKNMAIDIYDKADIVKKDDKYYYFVKNGSKNCFTCPFQTIIDNDWNNRFIRSQSRESNWHLVAIGDENAVKNDKIAETEWNAPTSWYYGQIRFGNKKNIALYFVKRKNKITDYNLLNETQKANIDNEINVYVNEYKMKYTIDLNNINPDKKAKTEITYCSNEPVLLNNNKLQYAGIDFWDLDNL
jgi:hypothetical protein